MTETKYITNKRIKSSRAVIKLSYSIILGILFIIIICAISGNITALLLTMSVCAILAVVCLILSCKIIINLSKRIEKERRR